MLCHCYFVVKENLLTIRVTYSWTVNGFINLIMLLTQHRQGESKIEIGKHTDPNFTDIPQVCGLFSGFQSCLHSYHHLTRENRPFFYQQGNQAAMPCSKLMKPQSQ